MLYVFHGTDVKKVADKTNNLVNLLLEKKPDAQVFSFEGLFLDEIKLDEVIEAQGLFVEKHIVVLKQVFEFENSRKVVLKHIERIANTQNIFILSENKLLASHKKVLEKHAKKIEEHKSVAKKDVFNVFSLSDAFCKRNKRELWLGYVKALRSGVSVENIHGTLHWTARRMLIASKGDTKGFGGSFYKYKKYATNFSFDELLKISRDLISIYHKAREGRRDLKTSLEKWILDF